MKTKLNLIAAGIFLATVSTGFGQSIRQVSTNLFHAIENAGLVSLSVQRTENTNTGVSTDCTASDLTATNSPSGLRLRVPVAEWAVSQFQGEAGDNISYRPSSQVGVEAGDKPAVIYSAGLELRAPKPINVVPSKKYPGIEYSGIFVQAARSNPLQLFNPFAPAIYGNGEANVVRNLITREVEGLKLWRISF